MVINKIINNKIIILTAAILAITGCSANSSQSAPQAASDSIAGYYGDSGGAPYEAPAAVSSEESGEMYYYDNGKMTSDSAAPDAYQGTGDQRESKIIKTGFVNLETNAFDDSVSRIETLVKEAGGYVENSNLHNANSGSRIFEAVYRVPSESFDQVKRLMEGVGRVVSSSEQQENVSPQYYDTQARLETKNVEEQRLLDMIAQTNDVKTLLALEQYLAEVRTDIEIYASRLKDIDSRSSFSTLTLSLYEQLNVRLTAGETPFGARLTNSFVNSVNNTITFFENVCIFLAGSILPLLFIAIVVTAGLVTYKFFSKKHKERIV
ncbi:MAG: DUF4349 domain-containing protein [Clostridiales bacterium]|jgi:hypothetical protein|nr:DUF4349 domain-containing protein [Clostridiales bacterium]